MKFQVAQRVLKLPGVAWRHWLGIAGIIFTTVFAVLMVAIFLVELVGFHPGPYSGIITFMVIPGAFVLSLFLIPLGGYLARRKETRRTPKEKRGFGVIDLNQKSTRQMLATIAILTVLNLLFVGTATYKGIHYMETVQFCGQTCHAVMDPEYVAYARSPHSRVECVECHIGPGAPWFVKSKISGSYQVVSVLFDLFEKPIPVPVKSLRPARETCEQCHWPTKFHGKKMHVVHRYETNAANTRLTNVMMMNIGGINPKTKSYEGIHYHVSPDIRVSYFSTDDKREKIPQIIVEDDQGRREVFTSDKEFKPPEGAAPRVMDCIDCHNRPTHIFEDPAWALDDALEAGQISPELPFAKKAVLAAMTQEYGSHDEARTGIERSIRSFYETEGKGLEGVTEERIAKAASEAAEIYARNVFPSVRIGWKTYPNQIGHTLSTGCFRCHDDEHTSEQGNVISQDCDLCHTLIAVEEEEPEILDQLAFAP